MKVYKLTDQEGYTRRHDTGETCWEVGKTYTKDTRDTALCTDDVYHCYESPLLAVLMNPMHASIQNPRIFECEADVCVTDGLKSGTKNITVVREMELPKLTTVSIVAFGILCAKAVHTEPNFQIWANNWLSGKDRSLKAAHYAAYAAASYATNTAASYATNTAAAYATHSASSYATNTAASHAAVYAARTFGHKINFIELAERCLTYE